MSSFSFYYFFFSILIAVYFKFQEKKLEIFRCRCCTRKFNHKFSCSRHVQSKVCGWQKKSEPSTGQFICDLCGTGFNLRDDLARHQDTSKPGWCKKMDYLVESIPECSEHEQISKQMDEHHDLNLSDATGSIESASYDADIMPPGFVNPLTNSCYLNSVLQAMLNTDNFTSWLMDYYYDHRESCTSNCKYLFMYSMISARERNSFHFFG